MTAGRRRKVLREAIKRAERACGVYERALQLTYIRLFKAQLKLYRFELGLVEKNARGSRS